MLAEATTWPDVVTVLIVWAAVVLLAWLWLR